MQSSLSSLRRFKLPTFPALLLCIFMILRADCDAAGKKWAVVVGIDKYVKQVTPLNCAVNDAKMFREALIKTSGFDENDIFLLTSQSEGNRWPDKGNIIRWISYIQSKAGPEDLFVFFFSGHGIDIDKETFLLTIESDPSYADTLEITALKHSELQKYVSKLPVGKILLFVDACRNDPRSGKGDVDNKMPDDFAKNLVIAPGTQKQGCVEGSFSMTFFSCQVGQRSYEWSEQGMGFFTYYLTKGLAGAARDTSGNVTIGTLEKYLGSEVRSAVQRERGEAMRQDPWVKGECKAGTDDWVISKGGSLPELSSLKKTSGSGFPVVQTTTTSSPGNDNATTSTGSGSSSDSSSSTSFTVGEPPVYTAMTLESNIAAVHFNGGGFVMGDKKVNEKTVRNVKVASFTIAKYEVTNSEYCAFLKSQGNQSEDRVPWVNINSDKWCGLIAEDPVNGPFSVKEGYEKRPVVYVSWYGAVAYCNWLSEKHGLTKCYGDKENRGDPRAWREWWFGDARRTGYRLPTEAEWEYASRGGSSTKYFWGDIARDEYSWYSKNSEGIHHDVGTKTPNALGLYDMSGNVWEWCSDLWVLDNYVPNEVYTTGPVVEVTLHVRRGGGFTNDLESCSSIMRFGDGAAVRKNCVGFRVVKNQ